jgi:hypothetical protein
MFRNSRDLEQRYVDQIRELTSELTSERDRQLSMAVEFERNKKEAEMRIAEAEAESRGEREQINRVSGI